MDDQRLSAQITSILSGRAHVMRVGNAPVVAVAGVIMPYRLFIGGLVDGMHDWTKTYDKENAVTHELRHETRLLNEGLNIPPAVEALWLDDPVDACRYIVKRMWNRLARESDGRTQLIELLHDVEAEYTSINV